MNEVVLERLRPAMLDAAERGIIYPFGALEQHGRHLPLGTDTLIVSRIAVEAASRARAAVCVAPCIPLGCSEHHLGVPGSHSIRIETMSALVKDLIRSTRLSGFRWALLLNGHGGNRGIIETAAAEAANGERTPLIAVANYWSLIQPHELAQIRSGELGSMGHACEFETAVVQAIDSDLVETFGPADDFVNPDPMLRADMFSAPPVRLAGRWVDQEEGNGVRGRPSLATHENGVRLLEASIDGLTNLIDKLGMAPAP